MKKNIKIKLKIIRIFIIAISLALAFNFVSPNLFKESDTLAVGDVNVNWGVPDGSPIFTVTNAAPGDIETRQVLVTNNAPTFRPVGVRGVEQGGDTLKNILQIEIKVDGTSVYGAGGAKTVEQFFTESSGPNGIFLTNINPSQTKSIDFIVTFPASAGNDFQNKSTIFDLTIGISVDLPDECDQLDLLPTPIIGSFKAETLTGTPGNDLIMGLEGADKINGLGGDDCILGGEGADKINGNDGNDAIFGENGADTINGNNGNDFVSGGEGGDTINGNDGADTILGENGGDTLDGGSGDDVITGGSGGDTIKGQNGNDRLFGNDDADTIKGGEGDDYIEGGLASDTLDGEGGNAQVFGNDGVDTLKGGVGNDTLDGGSGVDTANGNAGSDICLAETKSNCEF